MTFDPEKTLETAKFIARQLRAPRAQERTFFFHPGKLTLRAFNKVGRRVPEFFFHFRVPLPLWLCRFFFSPTRETTQSKTLFFQKEKKVVKSLLKKEEYFMVFTDYVCMGLKFSRIYSEYQLDDIVFEYRRNI